MAQKQSIRRISVLSVCISMLLLFTVTNPANARSYRDGSNTDWFRKTSLRRDGSNTDWFRKSSLRSDGPSESGRWFRFTGNRNWFGRSSLRRDVQDLDDLIQRLEQDAEALERRKEQLQDDNDMITGDGYNGLGFRRTNRRYM